MSLTHRSTTVVIFVFSFLAISCQRQPESRDQNSKGALEERYLKQGQEIAGTTFSILASSLKQALEEGGVANAIGYCSVAAQVISDSLSLLHDAEIRRVTLRPRNPKNAPTKDEKLVLHDYQSKKDTGAKLLAQVLDGDERTVSYYAPILISDFCLKCHGKIGNDIREDDYAEIIKRYPEDQAIGYAAGDLRGVWHIKLEK